MAKAQISLRMRRLIWAFAVRMYQEGIFSRGMSHIPQTGLALYHAEHEIYSCH